MAEEITAATIWLEVARRVDAAAAIISQEARKLDDPEEIRRLVDDNLGELVAWLHRTALHPPSEIHGVTFDAGATPEVVTDDDPTPVDP